MRGRLGRGLDAAGPLVQRTAAATLAWFVALAVGGHEEPVFAPIAVVVALSSPLGERGLSAVRLLLGVVVGIVAGELAVAALGGGPARVPVAVLAALAGARLVGGPRLVHVQAASAAILTVAAADGEAGLHRLVDAGIGAVVALLFSQVLLSPEPVGLVRRASAGALARMAAALTATAEALERGDPARADEATARFRDLRDELSELARLRRASGRVARHSALWRSRVELVGRENQTAGHLDVLNASCLMLARLVADPALGDGGAAPAGTAADVRRLAAALAAMAADPGDGATRQAAADDALAVGAGPGPAVTDRPAPAPAALVLAVRMVALDVMVVAGADLDDAAAALRRGAGEVRVPPPPRVPRRPFADPRSRRRPS